MQDVLSKGNISIC